MKWLVGAACVSVISATAYYFTVEYAAHAQVSALNDGASETKYCERSLDILQKYRAGHSSTVMSERTAAFIVSGCADKDANYALRAAPSLSRAD